MQLSPDLSIGFCTGPRVEAEQSKRVHEYLHHMRPEPASVRTHLDRSIECATAGFDAQPGTYGFPHLAVRVESIQSFGLSAIPQPSGSQQVAA